MLVALLVKIDIAEAEGGSGRRGLKEKGVNATIVERFVSMMEERHESVYVNESDGVWCNKGLVVGFGGTVGQLGKEGGGVKGW